MGEGKSKGGRWQVCWGVCHPGINQEHRTSRRCTLRRLSQELTYLIWRSDWASLKSIGQAIWKGRNSQAEAEAVVHSIIYFSSGKPQLCSWGPSTDSIRPTQVIQDNPPSLKPSDVYNHIYLMPSQQHLDEGLIKWSGSVAQPSWYQKLSFPGKPWVRGLLSLFPFKTVNAGYSDTQNSLIQALLS